MNSKTRREVLKLTEALIEERASQESIARLEKLVLRDPECMRCYLELMELHGNLYWDAAGQGSDYEIAVYEPNSTPTQKPEQTKPKSFSPKHLIAALAASLLVVVSIGFMLGGGNGSSVTSTNPEVENGNGESIDGSSEVLIVELPNRDRIEKDPDSSQPLVVDVERNQDAPQISLDVQEDQNIVSFINEQIESTWKDHDLAPSPTADDAEWVRRVHLDLTGRIPTRSEVESFLDDNRPDRRERLVDSLLVSRDFAANFASIWTNLLVGRSRERDIDRNELFSYLERQFGENVAWSNTVADLISAEGREDQSGPANFLLAHLNNEAVPATAITARIFLCEQMQCSQCHTHPTVANWNQNRFWEFNAFFQQTKVTSKVVADEKTGRKTRVRQLVDEPIEPKESGSKLEPDPTFYESLNGVMKVAYPKFADAEVKPSEDVSLREQLADLLTSPENPQFAAAFINRSWQHFFGYAFTQQVDDMGPHAKLSHPELLSGLSGAFAATGYDVRRLIRWICLSDAYQLSSTPIAANELDSPEAGDFPRFSRMYVKPLSPEQLFNSLRIASGVSTEQLLGRGKTFQQRDEWLQQFFVAAENEENSELTTFDGSLPQTLMMMNGNLIQQAVNVDESLILKEILEDPKNSEVDKINSLTLAALSRYPSEAELESIRKVVRKQIRQRTTNDVPAKIAVREAMRDLYWALLNSSEFSVNH